MNITSKKIIVDTNILTDLKNAGILDKFVKLNNIYLCDMVKNKEINEKTGDINLINKIKVMSATSQELLLALNISEKERRLSICDCLNYVIAKDNNCILATGDNKLKVFATSNGVQVIRTLKIIKLLSQNNILSNDETIMACENLINNKNTRIPLSDIEDLITELKRDLVTV